MLLSLFTFSRCNPENSGENGNGNENIDQCAVVDVDGNCYDTVHIGGQVWMKSNLRTTLFRDGSAIPLGDNCYGQSCGGFGLRAAFWTSTSSENEVDVTWARILSRYDPVVMRGENENAVGCSVRCVHN